MTSKDLLQFKVIGLAIALGLFLNVAVMLLNQGVGTPAYAAEGAKIQKVMLVDPEGHPVNQKVMLVDPEGRPINSYGMKFGNRDEVYLGLLVGGKMEMGLDEPAVKEPAPETP